MNLVYQVFHSFLEGHDVFAAMPTAMESPDVFSMLSHIYSIFGRKGANFYCHQCFTSIILDVRPKNRLQPST